MQGIHKVIKGKLLSLVLITILSGFMVSCGSRKSSSSYSAPKKEKVATHGTREKAHQVIKTARSYMGTNYKYGGTSKSGIDCSGLVLNSFQKVDVQLPHNSEAQSKVGQAIRVKDVQEGDLLFFSERKGSKKIGHVGIVTEVKSDNSIIFIHATTKAGVIENDLFSPYYYPLFIKAVRVL